MLRRAIYRLYLRRYVRRRRPRVRFEFIALSPIRCKDVIEPGIEPRSRVSEVETPYTDIDEKQEGAYDEDDALEVSSYHREVGGLSACAEVSRDKRLERAARRTWGRSMQSQMIKLVLLTDNLAVNA